jgi:uncharacterized protein
LDATAVNLIFQHVVFAIVLALIAAAYAAVGQAGATGYIAAMGFVGFTPDAIRPAALALNTLAAAIGTARFAKAGYLTWRGTHPFIILGPPFTVLGGATHLPTSIYNPVVGVLLILAAWRMAKSARLATSIDERTPRHPPLAPTRHAAGLSAIFNLLNSAAALAGMWSTSLILPTQLPSWLVAVAIGAMLGSWLGVKHLPPALLRYILSALLLVGGIWELLN